MLKNIFILTFMLASFVLATGQRSFYVSSSGFDTNDGLTPARAWKSIEKVNGSFRMMGRGDQVLFKTGDIFYGTLLPTVSGVTFGAYGKGAKPIITGLSNISSWIPAGKNIWEAIVPDGLATLNMVVINGIPLPVGRYPNAGTTNGGYLSYENYVNNASITDNKLAGAPDWTGGQLVVRQSDFVIKRLPITQHTGTQLSFTGETHLNANYGYFIQNHLSALDKNGEWLYDAVAHKIKMFYDSKPPRVQVATLANLVSMMYNAGNRKSNIIFKGIAFKGCEGVIMNLQYGDQITVDNCDFSYAGVDAIDHRNMKYFQVNNCAITDINMNGIHETNPGTGDHITIQNNSFKRIGVNPGMVSNNKMYADRDFTAINIGAGNLVIQENSFDSTGYVAISLLKNRNNQIVRKNIISNFCFLLNDGGAIYNSGLRDDPPASNVVIDSNIIFKSGDASLGTTSTNKHVRAIYLDASSAWVSVLNNTLFNVFEGIYISQAQHITIAGNTVYDAGLYESGPRPIFAGALSINDATEGYQHTMNNIIKNNIFVAKNPNQLLYLHWDSFNDADSVGIIDSNYYLNPMTDNPLFLTKITRASVRHPYSLSAWQAKYPGYDKHSKSASIKLPAAKINSSTGNDYVRFEYNATNLPKQISLGKTPLKTVNGQRYSGTYELPPFSSVIFIQDVVQ
ncbi:MAG: right-handed parallel beta-helix repeat-containing protein [Ferruginibacter sp.]